MALFVSYVASYAPIYRAAKGPVGWYSGREAWQRAYVPVEVLTERTNLRELFLCWADLWGVRTTIEFEEYMRTNGIT